MSTKPPEPSTVLGFTVQTAGTASYAFTHTISSQAHGNAGPHDKRPGYGQPGEPGGIHPVIQGEGAVNTESVGYVAPGVTYDDTPGHKRGWTSQNNH